MVCVCCVIEFFLKSGSNFQTVNFRIVQTFVSVICRNTVLLNLTCMLLLEVRHKYSEILLGCLGTTVWPR